MVKFDYVSSHISTIIVPVDYLSIRLHYKKDKRDKKDIFFKSKGFTFIIHGFTIIF